jgi:hypothetical protein
VVGSESECEEVELILADKALEVRRTLRASLYVLRSIDERDVRLEVVSNSAGCSSATRQ